MISEFDAKNNVLTIKDIIDKLDEIGCVEAIIVLRKSLKDDVRHASKIIKKNRRRLSP